MTTARRGQRVVDTVAFDVATLRPRWEHFHGPITTLVTFDRTRLLYSPTMDDVVVQRLPLCEGYVVTLPFGNPGRTEIDTIRVKRGGADPRAPRALWEVDLSEPAAIETFWIDRVSRRIVKHVYTWRRDGSHSDVVAEP